MENYEYKRWGEYSNETIDAALPKTVPNNTTRKQEGIWKQFMEFCNYRKYKIDRSTSVEMLATVLKDYAFNMRKSNGEEYKESVVNLLWNTVAKLLQQTFYDEFQIKFDPFHDVEFKQARCAKESKRNELKLMSSERKMAICWVPDCKHSENGICGNFFKFPQNKMLLKKWLMLVRRSGAIPTADSLICSCHFIDGNKNNLPTIFPGRLEQTERFKLVNMNDLSLYEEPFHPNLHVIIESGKRKQQKIIAPEDVGMYCRLCLNPVTKEQMICLGNYHNVNYPSLKIHYKMDKILQTETHVKMIRMLMPNFDHDIVYNPVMCDACRDRLQMSSDFVEQCMATQKLIQQFKDEHCPTERMVACEDVVLSSKNRVQVPKTNPKKLKKRKIVKRSSSKSVETEADPPDQVFTNPEFVKMEDIEEIGIGEQFEVIPEEIVEETIDVKAEEAIQTNVEVKTEPEHPLSTNSVIKNEPCSTATSNSTGMSDPNSVEQFSTTDASCNVNYLIPLGGLSSELSCIVPISNCDNLQVLVPEILDNAVNPNIF